MSEPIHPNPEFATKVVKTSIMEIKDAMPEELSYSVRFTASVHVYSWVIRKEKEIELIEWLKSTGFSNIQSVHNDIFATITATAQGSTSHPPSGCNQVVVSNCSSCSSPSSNDVVYITRNNRHYYYNCEYDFNTSSCYQSLKSCGDN